MQNYHLHTMRSKTSSSSKSGSSSNSSNFFGKIGESNDFIEIYSNAMTSQMKANIALKQIEMVAGNPLLGILSGQNINDVIKNTMFCNALSGQSNNTFNPFALIGMSEKNAPQIAQAPQTNVNNENMFKKLLEENNQETNSKINEVTDLITNAMTTQTNNINALADIVKKNSEETNKQLLEFSSRLKTTEEYMANTEKNQLNFASALKQLADDQNKINKRLNESNTHTSATSDQIEELQNAIQKIHEQDFIIKRLKTVIENNNATPGNAPIKEVYTPDKAYITTNTPEVVAERYAAIEAQKKDKGKTQYMGIA
jgi:hypothetical protein